MSRATAIWLPKVLMISNESCNEARVICTIKLHMQNSQQHDACVVQKMAGISSLSLVSGRMKHSFQ